MCALKRPFDDQSNSRIAVETLAVLQLLAWFDAGNCEIVNSDMLVLENARNPNPVRRGRVAEILLMFGRPTPCTIRVFRRASVLHTLGFDHVDALHIAAAETAGADVFVTCDDGILARARRLRPRLKVHAKNPIDLIRETPL